MPAAKTDPTADAPADGSDSQDQPVAEAAPMFTVGQLVTHSYEDPRHPTAEPRTLTGLVAGVDSDNELVSVVWLGDSMATLPFHQVSG